MSNKCIDFKMLKENCEALEEISQQIINKLDTTNDIVLNGIRDNNKCKQHMLKLSKPSIPSLSLQ